MVKYVPDYYAFLGIDESSDEKTIIKAYKRVSKDIAEIHDKKYRIVNDAYIVLTDKNKRKQYDKLRKTGLKNNKKNNSRDMRETYSNIKKYYDYLSKIYDVYGKIVKTQPLIRTSGMMIGGVAAGYGIKKGNEYIQRRRGKR